jgi:hypothetical protein
MLEEPREVVDEQWAELDALELSLRVRWADIEERERDIADLDSRRASLEEPRRQLEESRLELDAE